MSRNGRIGTLGTLPRRDIERPEPRREAAHANPPNRQQAPTNLQDPTMSTATLLAPATPPAAEKAPAAPRFDMYGPIHKALRSFMCDTLVRVGRMDPTDTTDRD